MKTKSAVFLGCGVVLFILVGAFLAGYLMFKGPKAPSVASDSWLVLDIAGEVPDYNEIRTTGFWGVGTPSVDEICRKIRRATNDSRIKGIVLKPSAAMVSYASLNEIAAALNEFKASKKSVLAHGVILSQKDYLLCSMADRVYMDPTASGGLILEGVSANVLFYKELLDKIGIKMHTMQSGEFKGAAEPYTQTSLSPGTEENLRQALKGRYDLIRADLAKYRKLDPAKVTDVYENRPDLVIRATDALKRGLIDKTATWDDFLTENGITEKKRVLMKDYQSSSDEFATGGKIAVLNLNGGIGPTEGYLGESGISAAKVERMLKAIRDDKSVKAVVLRVNSPGGSATESEIIYQKLLKLQIPIVVSMGGVAASGGYYISCAGDYIVADPYTITGSIGVIMALPEATKLGDKIGLDSQTLSYGKFAGFGSIFEPYDQELLNSLQRNSTGVYNEFKQHVMDARKIGPDRIGEVAEGRVFSAADAKAVGLVDEIGGLDFAVKKAAELAKVKSYSVQHFPRQVTFFDVLRDAGLFRMSTELLAGHGLSLEERLQKQLEKTLAAKEWLYFCPFKLD